MALTQIDDRGLKTPIDLLDNEKIRFGTGNDLQIYHDGTSAYIKSEISGHFNIDVQYDLYIRKQDGTEPRAKFHNDGSVELYYDGSKKFETNSSGVFVKSTIQIEEESGSEYYRLHTNGYGGLEIQNETTKVCEFTDASTLDFPDNNKIQLGTGSDLQIYHDGNNSWIKDAGTGALVLANSSGGVQNAAATENIIWWAENGDVELF